MVIKLSDSVFGYKEGYHFGVMEYNDIHAAKYERAKRQSGK